MEWFQLPAIYVSMLCRGTAFGFQLPSSGVSQVKLCYSKLCSPSSSISSTDYAASSLSSTDYAASSLSSTDYAASSLSSTDYAASSLSSTDYAASSLSSTDMQTVLSLLALTVSARSVSLITSCIANHQANVMTISLHIVWEATLHYYRHAKQYKPSCSAIQCTTSWR